ncbi:MAG: ArnT family glycosyltransferase [Nitrososphaerales archaeon]
MQIQRKSFSIKLNRKTLTGASAVIFYIALADFIFHMSIAGNYGYFRDELYYIVAGQRLAFGYVDFPPMIAFLAYILNFIAKDSLVSIHVIPALASSAIVAMSSKIASELGGGKRAQILSAVGAVFSASLAVGSIFSMDVLDMLWWTVLAYLLIKIIKLENKSPKLWIAFGIVAGIGLVTKLTIAFFLLSLLAAFVLTSKRRYLRSAWVWLGGVIAFLIVLPYIVWNSQNSWATVDFFFHHGGLNGGGPISFLAYQFLIAGILGLPLSICGLYFFFKTKNGKPFAALGVSFLILLILFTVTNAKPYFIMGSYPFLIAAGAIVIERVSVRRRIVFPTYLGGILLIGVLLAPLYAPVLPPQMFVQNYGSLTGAGNGAAAQQNAGAFPQYLGDRFGWNTMTRTVASVYQNLTAQEQSQACILTQNYGEASALTFLGKSYNLPPVISGHNNYYIWGPGKCSGAVLIIIGYQLSDFQGYFKTLYVAANNTCSYCMSSEDNIPVIVGIGLNVQLQSVWPMIKNYS